MCVGGSVTTPRHGGGHGPRLPRLLGAGPSWYDFKAGAEIYIFWGGRGGPNWLNSHPKFEHTVGK